MASPVVAGLAALLRSYYPELTAPEIKKIIESSVSKPDSLINCNLPGEKNKKIPFNHLCRSGGIINAFNAVKTANESKKIFSSAKPTPLLHKLNK